MSLGLLTTRGLRASWGATLTLGVVALLAALVLSAAPRAVAGVHARQLAFETDGAAVVDRDVSSESAQIPGSHPGMVAFEVHDVDPATTPPDAPDWAAYLERLEAVRAEQPLPLRDVLGAADFQVSTDDAVRVAPAEGSDLRSVSVFLRAAPRVQEHVEVVEGRWPQAAPVRTLSFPEGGGQPDVIPGQPVEMAVSRATAMTLGWEVGQVHPRLVLEEEPLRLVGVFDLADPDDPYWAHSPTVGDAYVLDDLNQGKLATAVAYVDPAMIAPVSLRGATTTVWYPVDAGGVRAGEATTLLAQLRGFTTTAYTVDEEDAFDPFVVRPASGLVAILDRIVAQRSGVDAILSVLAAGPLGATVAVLALGARLVVERRRPALALLRARGASGAQLRGLMAAEGLVVGGVASALGFGAGLLLVAGPAGGTEVLLAAGAGLAPAVALALASSPRGLRERRSDLSPRSRSRLRWVAEVLVHAGAVVSTWLLLQRGVVSGTAGAAGAAEGVDPLLAIAPLLLSLSATLLAVRAYPWLALAVERALAPRRDLVPFLGAARATRDPAGGPVPALALVLAVSVAATSGVLYATVSGGVSREAWSAVGADLRVSGPIVGAEEVAALAGIDGVAAVTAVTDLGALPLRVGLAGQRVDVVGVDALALAEVQQGIDGVPPDLARLAEQGAELRVVASPGTGVDVGLPGVQLAGPGGSAPVEVVTLARDLPGISASRAFVLVDSARAEELTGATGRARTALVALGPGADPVQVTAAVHELLPSALVEDPAQRAAAILASPVSSGLASAFLVAVALAALLCGAAVVMTLMLAGPARARLLAVLQTLGLSGRQSRGLVGWEIGPWTVVALVVGALLGAVVPRVVLAAVDVTALTAGDAQPDARFDPLLLAGVAGGFVVVVLLAAAVAAALGRRGEISAQLRIGEER
ncbi:FtsX-like permease family protein [Antribacter sp. KLBMP9083]|uniref:FtsX-like permease family protein n=1 Tax=Antribacter soli TaxID=2910976 RepID=A0AA41UCR7_9MICO|nr:FtsX-like permease family protein [Antribacter soli]MCF4122324.1 FtsX-like permease family protein [Antribacter soli]